MLSQESHPSRAKFHGIAVYLPTRKNWIFRLLRPLCTSFEPYDSPTSFFRLQPTSTSLLGFPIFFGMLVSSPSFVSVPSTRFLLRSLPFSSLRFVPRQRISSPRFKFESSLPRCLHEPVAIPSCFSLGKGTGKYRFALFQVF